ncbi:ABC transporter ATP-binding protein [Flammeovirga yaeyamensis]|uniref:ABC transporter ATP-binding protein n=1 Tax=Flammeovirga yaeyamensis TaxID=367791 RepID=A0AAX1MZS4_9BACT|nr:MULTISPECIES: ABC transporter ATP-binding protein [Flammeovirga]ANQ47841.1 ABC transporter ATP-binding protein [Flammeovirga sp. MY04]MBB3700312.1 peptide/nickel transport system ATP-binding protein [Flammeovirga yaeyamensis]NMF37062.1 ABC transporter ATP-binding protein [Flammeovirga yaeyamensis]QWG00754.1 ABC transporter ATP-binding protein [Flammeovirga yaeyamensis]
MQKNNSDILLEVKKLSISFDHEDRGSSSAVKNISFVLRKGETLGIVGESGSGKSVTALSMLQLLNKSSREVDGEILFHSNNHGTVDLLQVPKKTIQDIRGRDIGMIFQDPMSSLNPSITCGNQLIETIIVHEKVNKRVAKQRALETFATCQLGNPKKVFNSYPHQLSGGQKQRVLIAIALICNPSLLIADEPTTALDVTSQKGILDLFNEFKKTRNTATIFISHDLAIVAQMADRIAVMRKGKLVEYGTVYEVFNQPKHSYTKGLLACRPRLDFSLKRLPTLNDFTTDAGGNGRSKARFMSVGQALIVNAVDENKVLEQEKEILDHQPLLQVKNLSVEFPVKKNIWGKVTKSFVAVNNVSFDVKEGETLGLVGRSGCGKTTLGRTILQLIASTNGEVVFDGRELTKMPKKDLNNLRSDIQIIFQNPYTSLNPRLTIGQTLIEPMQVHKIYSDDKTRKKEAIRLLETVGLSANYMNRYPHEFSGGERQRICIARALSTKPKFIICDESVSALDVSVQAIVLNLLQDLKEKFNLTYIFISHDLAVVKFISDRILVMNKGEIVEWGLANEIYKSPKTEITKKLIESIPEANFEQLQKNLISQKLKDQKKSH